MSGRARNEATPESVSRHFRGSFTTAPNPDTFGGDLEQTCQLHAGFLKDLLSGTRRPLPGIVTKGLQLAFPGAQEAEKTAAALVELVRSLRKKHHNKGTGARLRGAVAELVAMFGTGEKKPTMAQKMTKHARVLQRQRSDPQGAIDRLYGLPAMTRPAQSEPLDEAEAPGGPVAVLSSQEVSSSQEVTEADAAGAGAAAATAAKPAVSTSASTSANAHFVQHWDAGHGCMVQIWSDSRCVRATMVPGDDGFLRALWPDGTWTATERPNLLMLEEPRKRPAAAQTGTRKRPAAAAAAPAPAAAEDDPSDKSTDGAEEGEEDAGAAAAAAPAAASSAPGSAPQQQGQPQLQPQEPQQQGEQQWTMDDILSQLLLPAAERAPPFRGMSPACSKCRFKGCSRCRRLCARDFLQFPP